jgi:hypothetical protein
MVTLDEARNVVGAAENKKTEIRQAMNIALVDEGGTTCFPCPNGWSLGQNASVRASL